MQPPAAQVEDEDDLSPEVLEKFFEGLNEQSLADHAINLANEYNSLLRKKILEEGRIDILAEEVLGYKLEWFHKGIINSQNKCPPNGTQLTLGFRGSGKSTIGTITRCIFEMLRNPNTRILVVSNTQLQAEIFMREVKTHFEANPKLIGVFGDWVGKKWDTREIIVNKREKIIKESTVSCVGVGGPTASRHYDLVLCCHPDTEVVTRRGLYKIKDLELKSNKNLKVMGHDGKYHKVSKVYKREYKGKLYGIRPYKSCGTTWVTPNHPILVKRHNSEGLPETKFVNACDIKLDDRLPYPKSHHNSAQKISQRDDINVLLKNKRFWRWLGYHYAEGSICPEYRRVRLTFGTSEEENVYIDDCLDCMEEVFGKRPRKVVTNNGTITQISLSDSRFEFLRDCGRLSHEKYLPYWIKGTLFPKFKEFLIGYWRGDGHIARDLVSLKGRRLQVGFASVSKSLLSDIRQCLLDYNISTSLRKSRDADPQAVVCGNIVSSRTSYTLMGDTALSDFIGLEEEVDIEVYAPATYHFDERFYCSSIREIETTEYHGDVYNLEVEDAHTYCHDLVVSHNCDDIVNEENARTELQRERLKVWYYKSLVPTLLAGGKIFLAGTLWNPADFYNYLIANNPALVLYKFPAIVDEDTENERSAWPEEFSLEEFKEKRKDMGVPIFQSQMQQTTDAMQGQIFSYDELEFYTSLPEELLIFQACDLAISQKDHADYFAHCTIGYERTTKKCYVIDIFRTKADFNKQTDIIVKRYYKYNPIKCGVEANAYQAAQVHNIKAQFPDVRVIPIYTSKDKITRAMKFAAKCSSGDVLFKKTQIGLIEELLSFPNGDHDDRFDALELCASLAERGSRKKREKEPGVF